MHLLLLASVQDPLHQQKAQGPSHGHCPSQTVLAPTGIKAKIL